MGCTSTDGGYSKESTKDNINFLVEICSSWGYQQRQTAVKEFVEYLQTNGYKQINVDFIAKGGGKGEFFVSLKKGKLFTIFSNNKKLHPDAITSFALNKKLYEDIKSKIDAIL